VPCRHPITWKAKTFLSLRGSFGGLSPQTNLQAPQNEILHAINPWFYQILECQKPCTVVNPPYWRFFGDGSDSKLDELLFSFTAVVQIMWPYQFIITVWHRIAYPLTHRSHNSHLVLARVSQLWCFRAGPPNYDRRGGQVRPAKTFCQWWKNNIGLGLLTNNLLIW